MIKVLVVWLGRQNFFAVKVMKFFSIWKTLIPYLVLLAREDNFGDYQLCGFPRVQLSWKSLANKKGSWHNFFSPEIALYKSHHNDLRERWLGRQNSFAVKIIKLFSTWKTLLTYLFLPVREDNFGDYQFCGFPQVQISCLANKKGSGHNFVSWL